MTEYLKSSLWAQLTHLTLCNNFFFFHTFRKLEDVYLEGTHAEYHTVHSSPDF